MGHATKIRILDEGDKSSGICPYCKEIRPVTYFYRDYTTAKRSKIRNVLQGFCDVCGHAVVIPAQSTPKIKQYLEDKNVPLEVRVPPVLEDVIYNVGRNSHLEPPRALKSIIKFYSRKMRDENPAKRTRFSAFIEKKVLLKEARRSRISMRISKSDDGMIQTLADRFSINKSEYVLGLLCRAREDLVENRYGKNGKEFYQSVKLLSD